MVVANLEELIFLASQIVTFVSLLDQEPHAGNHPVNHLQIKLWKTAGHGLCTMSDPDAKGLPPGITPLFFLLGLHQEGYAVEWERTQKRWNEHCGIMISHQPNCFGFSVFKILDFRPSIFLVWPPLSSEPFIWKKSICMNLYLSRWCYFYFLYPVLIYCQVWKLIVLFYLTQLSSGSFPSHCSIKWNLLFSIFFRISCIHCCFNP